MKPRTYWEAQAKKMARTYRNLLKDIAGKGTTAKSLKNGVALANQILKGRP